MDVFVCVFVKFDYGKMPGTNDVIDDVIIQSNRKARRAIITNEAHVTDSTHFIINNENLIFCANILLNCM